MELQFQISKHSCLKPLQVQSGNREQTQELRLPEGYPDIGRVLAAWGQAVLRGKHWQSDTAGFSCGVMAWVLYAPEDGTAARSVECWIPMTVQWEHEAAEADGTLLLNRFLQSVDARAVSGRKLIVRASLGVQAQMYVPSRVTEYVPENLPEDICLLQRTYPVCLAMECGERAFAIDEELTLPAAAPAPEKLISYGLTMYVEDKKVLGDKAVFRGNGQLHLLYRTVEGTLAAWELSVPFSQYAELTAAYGNEAQIRVVPAVTALELEMGEQGRLRLKAGLSGQYVLYDTRKVTVVEDAYSPERSVTCAMEAVEFPSLLDRQSQTVTVEQTVLSGSSRAADVAAFPTGVHTVRRGDQAQTELTGQLQALYYDTEDALQAACVRWQEQLTMTVAENACLDISCAPAGKPELLPGEDTTVLRGALALETRIYGQERYEAVSGLTVGEATEKDPGRPSLILCRAGEQSLWELAKAVGSTVEAIREANGIQGEPETGRMLLIPVP